VVDGYKLLLRAIVVATKQVQLEHSTLLAVSHLEDLGQDFDVAEHDLQSPTQLVHFMCALKLVLV